MLLSFFGEQKIRKLEKQNSGPSQKKENFAFSGTIQVPIFGNFAISGTLQVLILKIFGKCSLQWHLPKSKFGNFCLQWHHPSPNFGPNCKKFFLLGTIFSGTIKSKPSDFFSVRVVQWPPIGWWYYKLQGSKNAWRGVALSSEALASASPCFWVNQWFVKPLV